MKKWTKIYWIIIGIIIAGFYMPVLVTIFGKPELNEAELGIYRLLVSGGTLIFVFAILLYILLYSILLLKSSVHNIKKCDDDIFDEIDKYRRRWGERNGHYLMCIQKINYIYRENGEVHKLVQNKQLDRLYKRLDFLNVQENLYDVLMTALSSLVISILASVFCNITDNENGFIVCGLSLIIILAFFINSLFRYHEKGRFGSYEHCIYEYEKKLLLEKIEDLERKLQIKEEDIDFLETKHIILNVIIDLASKRKNKKLRKQFEEDMEIIEKLNLETQDGKQYEKQEILIDDKSCYLLYIRQFEKVGEEEIPKLKLANEEFEKLYNILIKYDLINK